MPIYRKDSEVKVVAPRSFTDHAIAAEVQATVDAKVDKMKMNLKSSEYREVFAEWDRLKQESAQRLQRIEQINNKQHHELQRRRQQLQQQRSIESTTTKSSNSSSNASEVMRSLRIMKMIVGENP